MAKHVYACEHCLDKIVVLDETADQPHCKNCGPPMGDVTFEPLSICLDPTCPDYLKYDPNIICEHHQPLSSEQIQELDLTVTTEALDEQMEEMIQSSRSAAASGASAGTVPAAKMSDLGSGLDGLRFRVGIKQALGGEYPYIMIFPPAMGGGHFKFHATMSFVMENNGDFSHRPKNGPWSSSGDWSDLEFEEIHWTSSNGGKEKWTDKGVPISGGDGNPEEAKRMWEAYMSGAMLSEPVRAISRPIPIPTSNPIGPFDPTPPNTPEGGWPNTP